MCLVADFAKCAQQRLDTIAFFLMKKAPFFASGT